jgi:hypothetical protein
VATAATGAQGAGLSGGGVRVRCCPGAPATRLPHPRSTNSSRHFQSDLVERSKAFGALAGRGFGACPGLFTGCEQNTDPAANLRRIARQLEHCPCTTDFNAGVCSALGVDAGGACPALEAL